MHSFCSVVCASEGEGAANEARAHQLLLSVNCDVSFSQSILDICLTLLGTSSEVTAEVLKLQVQMYLILKANIPKSHISNVVPILVSLLAQSQRGGDYQLVGHILKILKVCKLHLHSYLPLLLPVMSQFIQVPGPPGGDVPSNLKKDLLITLGSLTAGANLVELGGHLFAGQTLLSLIKLFQREPHLWDTGSCALENVLEALGPHSSSIFAKSIEKV